jgi:hypothetical protein
MYVFAGTDDDDYDDLHVLQWGSSLALSNYVIVNIAMNISELTTASSAEAAPVRPPPRRPVVAAVPARKAPDVEPPSGPATTTPTTTAPPSTTPAVPAPAVAASVSPVAAAKPPAATPAPKPEPAVTPVAPSRTAAHTTAAPSALPSATAASDSIPALNLKFDIATNPPASRKTVAPAKVGPANLRKFDDKKAEMVNTIDGLFKQLQTEFQKVLLLALKATFVRKHVNLLFSRYCL